MKIYGHPGSICTNRVLFTFAEKSVEPELAHVDLAKGDHQSSAHVARHPFGMIPVLEDGAFSLYESRAIMRYLDDALPGAKLTPADPRARAAMEQWISVEASYVSPPVSKIVEQKFLVPMRGGAIDLEALEAARSGIGRALDVVDAALARHPHLAGEAFTLADVSLAPVVGMLVVAGESTLVASRRNLGAWWERVSSRPSWRNISARR